MTQTPQGAIPAGLQLGDVLPSKSFAHNEANHLYVSLSQLIQEHIFYHPEIGQHLDALSATDKTSLDSLLNGSDLATHFVTTLVTAISGAIQPNHNQVRVCLSDADSHEYSALLGGQIEAQEINPAIGLRGVSRFASEQHSQSFVLECEVIKQLRAKGIDVEIVVPFVRALSDAAMVIDRLAVQGLPRGLNGLKVLYCCDTPAAVLLAERLLQYFDGLVVNTDNLTQLTLGVDPYNEALQFLFDPQHEAVLSLINQAAKTAANANKPCILYCQNLAQYSKMQDTLAELENIQVLAAV